MSTRALLIVTSAIAATVACLGGANGSAAPRTAATAHAVMLRQAPNSRISPPPALLDTQTYHNEVIVYGVSGGTPLPTLDPLGKLMLTYEETITMGLNRPVGAVSTIKGHVYITNGGDANILVFAFEGSNYMLIKTLVDPGQLPYDVAANVSESLIAVSNSMATSGSPTGSISLYAGGSTSPTGSLGVTFPVVGVGVAMDKAGDCFWSYQGSGSNPNAIVEFKKCAGSAKTIISGLAKSGGIAFDGSGNLYYTDQGKGTVYRCTGLANCKPLKSGFVDPFFLHFDKGWKHLWLTDPGTGYIYALNPTTGRRLNRTLTRGGQSDPAFGIAPDPGSQF